MFLSCMVAMVQGYKIGDRGLYLLPGYCFPTIIICIEYTNIACQHSLPLHPAVKSTLSKHW